MSDPRTDDEDVSYSDWDVFEGWLLGLIAGFLIAFLLFVTPVAEAKDFKLLELDELSLNYKNFAVLNDKARNMLIYPEHPKEGVNVNINNTVAKYGYWNSTIESLTTGAQYRAIGLEMRLGVHLGKSLDVGYYHHSQHLIDRHHSYMEKFPVEDAVEVKLYLYRGDK